MIVLRFKVQCQPHKTEQVMAALTEVIAPSRAVTGVISFDIARDLANPNSFIATEVFGIRQRASDKSRCLRLRTCLRFSRSP
jgi:quinol monooxygenase YgiN